MAGENPGYVQWVKRRRCCVCGEPGPSDPHHMPRKHGGRRGPDHTCIPVCRICHDYIQHPASIRHDDKHGLDMGEVEYRQWHTHQAAVLFRKYEMWREAFAGAVVAEIEVF